MIAARGYWTATDPADLADLGFAPHQCELVPALVIPEYSTAGFQTSAMLRPDRTRTDDKGKAIKYEKPVGSRPMVDAGPNNGDLRNPAIPLVITEGSKKRDALADRGFCAISLAGVFGFMSKKLVIPDFDDINFHGRDVILAFDSDVITKPTVADALHRLAGVAKRRGARTVRASYLPHGPGGDKMGADDFFALSKTAADFLATVRDIPHADEYVIETVDDVTAQHVADLEAQIADLTDELRVERDERALERRILGDSRRPAQERIAAVLFAWEVRRIHRHGDGKLGRGTGLAPVIAVDASGDIFASVKRTAELSGTSPKNMGDYLSKWTTEGVIDRPRVTRVRVGESVTRDGEIKPRYESTARVRPRGSIDGLLHDFLLTAPTPTPRAKPKPKDRCLEHPDADLIRRVTVECSVCHELVAPERASWHCAGTPPEVQESEAREQTADLPLSVEPIQNTPPVISENETAPRRPDRPHVSLVTPPVISEPTALFDRTPIDRWTDITLLGGRP